jgi:putative transposase
MKTSRFSDTQIIPILKQAEAVSPVPEHCREHGICTPPFYKWRSKFGGMDASLMARLKELEDENRRLKKMYAEERLKTEIITEAMAKSGSAICPQGDDDPGRGSLRHIHLLGLCVFRRS